MKKLLIIALTGFSMVACTKDYTCACTTTVNNNGVTTTTSGTSTIESKKKSDAESQCNQLDNSTTVVGVNTTVECNIQ